MEGLEKKESVALNRLTVGFKDCQDFPFITGVEKANLPRFNEWYKSLIRCRAW
jgi:hypothetical protein